MNNLALKRAVPIADKIFICIIIGDYTFQKRISKKDILNHLDYMPDENIRIRWSNDSNGNIYIEGDKEQ